MITDTQYRELGFKFHEERKGFRLTKVTRWRTKEKYIWLGKKEDSELLVVRGATMFVITDPMWVNEYFRVDHFEWESTRARYFNMLWSQPNKDIKRYSFNALKHLVNTLLNHKDN